MNSLNTFLLAVTAFFLLTITACDKDDPVATETEQEINGSVTGVAALIFDDQGNPSAFQVRGAVVSGSVKGTSDADLAIKSIDSNGTIHFEGGHIFYNEAGNVMFKTSDKGTATADGQIDNSLTITEGSSGQFTTKGNVNLQTGALNLTYEGKAKL